MKRNVPLSGYSTFGVGGPAEYFVDLADLGELPSLLRAAHHEGVRVFVLGGGSNVLFPDEGYRGLIVRITAAAVHVDVANNRIVAEAGARWSTILNAMEKAGLSGLEKFNGLPGTIGGAIRGNAGCFGLEMKDVLEKAILYDPQTEKIREVDSGYFEFAYRFSRLKKTNEIILNATLKLIPSLISRIEVPGDINSTIPIVGASMQHLRFQKQPPGKSSGSFFKNPSPEQPAGKLIDECGLKGLQIGGAQISPKHGNFFMNVGGATAADILALRDRAKEAVKEKFGIELEEEAVIVSN